MKHFSQNEIGQLEHLYKINLINSCSGFKSANLIGSKSMDGISNVAVFSSVTHFGSSPAILGFLMRPTTVPRNTYCNIRETGAYSINHIHAEIIEDAHHTSAKYDRNISEFDMTGLREEYKVNYEVPFVKGAPVQIGMRYLEEYRIKANGTIMLIGEMMDIFIKDELLRPDGFVDLSRGNVAAINGLDGYVIPEFHKRMPYQRPKKVNRRISRNIENIDLC